MQMIFLKNIPQKGPLWRSTISLQVDIGSDIASIYEYFSKNEFLSTTKSIR